MIEIKPSQVTEEVLRSSDRMPLIVCADAPRVIRKVLDAGYEMISVNMHLAKALMDYPQEERRLRAEEEFKAILAGKEAVFLENYEMLFDPRYQIDVIKCFCDRARHLKLATKWPGICSGNDLTYAEPDAPDYYCCDCSKLQIRIVR